MKLYYFVLKNRGEAYFPNSGVSKAGKEEVEILFNGRREKT